MLAAALAATPGELPAGLELYERARRPRASRVVITSRERGVDNHLISPLAGLAARSHDRRAKAYRLRSGGPRRGWIWDYDAGSESALAA